MQNHLRKSSNNTLDSLLCKIKRYLDKTVHLIVKETHRLHNAVTELDIAKLTPCFFQCFITRPLVITMLRYLAFLSSSIFLHTKHNLLMSNNLDQIWFWKNFPITFSQGCTNNIQKDLSPTAVGGVRDTGPTDFVLIQKGHTYCLMFLLWYIGTVQ